MTPSEYNSIKRRLAIVFLATLDIVVVASVAIGFYEAIIRLQRKVETIPRATILRALAKWWAKGSYRWKLEVEGHKNESNAKLAVKNAQAKRELLDQLNREAVDIEANIKRE